MCLRKKAGGEGQGFAWVYNLLARAFVLLFLMSESVAEAYTETPESDKCHGGVLFFPVTIPMVFPVVVVLFLIRKLDVHLKAQSEHKAAVECIVVSQLNGDEQSFCCGFFAVI